MADPTELLIRLTRGASPFTTYYLRGIRWRYSLDKHNFMSPMPGDIEDGSPRRLGLDYGSLSELVIVWGRIKESDRNTTHEPTKYELSEAARTWWVDAAKSGWYLDMVILAIDEFLIFTGIMGEIRFERLAGQDDWVDFTLKFYVRERIASGVPV